LPLVDYGYGMGYQGQYALEEAGITVNKNTIPAEPSSPFYPSGIRLGTPILTTRDMKEKEMVMIAGWIADVINEIGHYQLPESKEERIAYLKKFREEISKNQKIKNIKGQVLELCKRFPIYGGLR